MQNVDEKGIISLGDFRLVVAKLNQSRFTHTARRDNNQIIAVGNRLDKPGRFTYTVTEILRSDFSGYDKWICNFRHNRYSFLQN